MKRLETKRKNPMERRTDPDDVLREGCEKTCPVAIRNHERIEAAFTRIDESRSANENRHIELKTEITKIIDGLNSKVRFQVFSWVIGILIVIFSTLLGIVWKHQGENENLAKQTIEKIERTSTSNAQKIEVTVQRVNDFIISHDQYLQRNQIDFNRMIGKLDEIEKTVKNVEIDVGALKSGKNK